MQIKKHVETIFNSFFIVSNITNSTVPPKDSSHALILLSTTYQEGM